MKDSPSEELACSIRSIMDGKRIYSPNLWIDDSNNNDQEMDVLGLLADGQITIDPSNQQSNTIGTVRKYFSTIMDKMRLPTG